VDKLQATFESKLDSCFLEFEFGGITREEATDEAITKKIKKKRKDKGIVKYSLPIIRQNAKLVCNVSMNRW
jgi:hypothetical protein